MLRILTILCISIAIFFVGCISKLPPTRYPNRPLAETWDLPESFKCSMEEDSYDQEDNPPRCWWQAFDDPILDTLIMQAISDNPDVFIALNRILEQRALLEGAIADKFPFVSLQTGPIEAFLPAQGVFLGQQNLINLLNSQNVSIQRYLKLLQFGPSLVWEIDIFQKLRYAALANCANVVAAKDDLQGLQLSLSSDVAKNYIELRNAETQLVIEKDYYDLLLLRKTILEERLQLANSSLEPVEETKTKINRSLEEIFQLENTLAETKRKLLTLLGRGDVGSLSLESESFGIPQPKYDIRLGVPSDLLTQRPDISQAAKKIVAAEYRLKSKRAEALPSFVILGAIGGLSPSLSQLLSFQNLYALLYPFLDVSLFDAGKNRAAVCEHYAKVETAVGEYQKTILKAVEEVQIAIYLLNFQDLCYKIREDQVKDNMASYTRVSLQYEEGMVDYLALCKVQDNLYASKKEVYLAMKGISLSFIDLCKSLGGSPCH